MSAGSIDCAGNALALWEAEPVVQHRDRDELQQYWLLAYQAARFPLYEQPSEILALLVKRADTTADLVKVYIAADNDATLPKPILALSSVELDVAEGWRFYGVFHNHTFNHSEDRGKIPVAAPSAGDLEISVTLSQRLGLELIMVTDGFSTLELTAEEFKQLARAADDQE